MAELESKYTLVRNLPSKRNVSLPAKPTGYEESTSVQKYMASAAWRKLQKWYTTTDSRVLAVAAVLDPRIKLDFFRNSLHWDDIWMRGVETKVFPIFLQVYGNSS